MKASLAQSNCRLFRSIYAAWSYKKPTTWILIGIVEARHEHNRAEQIWQCRVSRYACDGSERFEPFDAAASLRKHRRSADIALQGRSATLAVKAGDDDFVVAHISRGARGHGMTEPHPKRAIHTACVHLSEFSGYGIWCDEKFSYGRPLPQGSIHINDMRHSWCADIQGGFDVVNFCVPQSALDEMTEDHDSARIVEIRCPMGEAQVDTVAMNLALAFVPALLRPNQLNQLFVDHAWRAVTAYLARTYGSHGQRISSGQGGLAPWQERRAKEMLIADSREA